ncbi:hypothetical protein SDJN02_01153, partial [Cucurbita argyrosperma subsp. argyrosperma]
MTIPSAMLWPFFVHSMFDDTEDDDVSLLCDSLEDQGDVEKLKALCCCKYSIHVLDLRFLLSNKGRVHKLSVHKSARQGSWYEPLKDVQGKLTGIISDHIFGLQAEVGRTVALDGGTNAMVDLIHL